MIESIHLKLILLSKVIRKYPFSPLLSYFCSVVVYLMYLYHHIPAIALYRSVEGGFLFQLLCSLWCVPIIGYIIWSECHIRISLSSLCRLILTLRWRHNARDGVSNHQRHDCLLNSLFGRRSKKTSKLCVAGLCAGKSPGTGEFPAQMASYA